MKASMAVTYALYCGALPAALAPAAAGKVSAEPSLWRLLGAGIGHDRRMALHPTLYGIPNCDTVRKARLWLKAQGIEAGFHDFRKDGVPTALDGWVAALGWETLLNRRGLTWRRLDEAARAAARLAAEGN